MLRRSTFPCSKLSLLIRGLLSVAFVVSGNALAREYSFSSSSLEGNEFSQQNIDLSLFSRENAQMPGT